MAASKGSITETDVKHGAAPFEPEEAFFELNALGLGGGEDEVGEMTGFERDHFTASSRARAWSSP